MEESMSQDQTSNYGTALLEKAEAPESAASAAVAGVPDAGVPDAGVPDQRLAQAYRRWDRSMKELADVAHGMVAQYPEDRAARYFLAETMLASGCADLALDQYEWLRVNAPAAELPRIVQGMEQCLADHHYFPPSYAHRFTVGEYVTGHNAEVWKKYQRRDIQRGREIVRTIRQWMPVQGKRVLDVGGGYGGMMISMAEQGAHVTGVEIDPERAHTGKQRLAELGIACDYRVADICDPIARGNMGLFDVITCQDVLEHVMDPTLMVQTMCSMLKPGGVIFVQVPNKWGAQQLMSDHHYALTGITALSRKQAIEYWQLATGEEAQHYGVGYPRGERYYMNAFARCGVTLNHLQKYNSLAHVAWFARDISALCERLQKEIYPGLRPELQARVRRRIIKVLELYSHASEVIKQMQSQQQDASEACDQIVRRLCAPLWRFIGVKAAK
jgi:2-polyprenyl-3-methyl-5-hydroxy-6-metoxy-1,4-benzoquinol methylase